MRILILCTGNSSRSQMAEAFLRSFSGQLEVYSAGTAPAARVHPKTIAVMREVGIDTSDAVPKNVDNFRGESFDFVITVCDNARESCPVFTGRVDHRLHIGFEDPAKAEGSEEEKLGVFRRVRDEIRERFFRLYVESVKC
jgi:arsenate reductase